MPLPIIGYSGSLNYEKSGLVKQIRGPKFGSKWDISQVGLYDLSHSQTSQFVKIKLTFEICRPINQD